MQKHTSDAVRVRLLVIYNTSGVPNHETTRSGTTKAATQLSRAVFLNRRTAARYRALASIIPGREIFSWNLSS